MTDEKKQMLHQSLIRHAERLEEEAKVIRSLASYLIHPHGG